MLTKRERLRKNFKRGIACFRWRAGGAKPVFICGEQRSGTNFLINVLNRRLDTECYLENDDEAFDEYVLRHIEVVEKLILASRFPFVVFKSICDSQNIDTYLERFSGSMAIWAFRHYTDVVNSSLRNFSQHNKYLDLILNDPQEAAWRVQNMTAEDKELVQYHYNRGVSDASARTLIWCLRNKLFFQQKLDTSSNVLVTKYEDLVTTPEQRFERVYLFLSMSPNRDASKIAFSSSLKRNAPQEIDAEIKDLADELYSRMLNHYERQEKKPLR